MFDPVKTASSKQFSSLNGLSNQQVTDLATRSGLYQVFYRAGYSNAWIAADLLAWQRLQQKIIILVPVVILAIFLAGICGDMQRLAPSNNYKFQTPLLLSSTG